MLWTIRLLYSSFMQNLSSCKLNLSLSLCKYSHTCLTHQACLTSRWWLFATSPPARPSNLFFLNMVLKPSSCGFFLAKVTFQINSNWTSLIFLFYFQLYKFYQFHVLLSLPIWPTLSSEFLKIEKWKSVTEFQLRSTWELSPISSLFFFTFSFLFFMSLTKEVLSHFFFKQWQPSVHLKNQFHAQVFSISSSWCYQS